jgi:hypothetical protein
VVDGWRAQMLARDLAVDIGAHQMRGLPCRRTRWPSRQLPEVRGQQAVAQVEFRLVQQLPVPSSPFPGFKVRKTLDDVEYPTMEWVDWYNNRHLHSVLDYVPPRNTKPPTTLNSGRPSRRCLKHEAGIKPGAVHPDRRAASRARSRHRET